MRRFQFPLERLRLWRERQLELEEQKLLRLQAELAALDAAQRRVREEEFQAVESVTRMREVSTEQLRLLEQWRGYAEREVRRLNSCMAEVAQRISDQKQILIEARRRLESMNQLKSDALAKWTGEANREQEAQIDELVVSRWGRG